MKFIYSVFILLAASFSGHAQSFFRAIPKPELNELKYSIADSSGSTVTPVLNAWRPIINSSSYGIPGNVLLTGAGAGFQHLQYDSEADKWNCIYSINAIAWYTASLSGNQNTVFAYGIAGGIWNNNILIGIATTHLKSAFLTLGIGINLNN